MTSFKAWEWQQKLADYDIQKIQNNQACKDYMTQMNYPKGKPDSYAGVKREFWMFSSDAWYTDLTKPFCWKARASAPVCSPIPIDGWYTWTFGWSYRNLNFRKHVECCKVCRVSQWCWWTFIRLAAVAWLLAETVSICRDLLRFHTYAGIWRSWHVYSLESVAVWPQS